MKKMNNKGFALVETLVAASFVVVLFMVIFENYYPLIAKYNRFDNYDDIDTKYIAYYLRKMVNSSKDATRNDIASKLGSGSFYKFNNGGSELCSLLSTQQQQDTCVSYINTANITNIYLTKYNTTSLKTAVKNGSIANISRAFELYVGYMPTFSSTASLKPSFIRLIVEVRHENDDTSKEGDYYYTYSNIELDTTSVDLEEKSYQIVSGDTNNIEAGQAISFDSEVFYVISINSTDVMLLSAYDLNVGEYSTKNLYGYQDVDAGVNLLYTNRQVEMANTTSSETNYVTTTIRIRYTPGGITNSGLEWINPTTYNNDQEMTLYLNNYRDYLKTIIKDADTIEVRLPTKDEANNLKTYSWFNDRSYWLSTGIQSSDCVYVVKINTTSIPCISEYDNIYEYGLRPIVVLPKSVFGM